MDGGFPSDLEFFPPSDKPASSVAVASACPGLGIYQNEESVDLSSWILEACSEVPVASAPSPAVNSSATQPNYREAPNPDAFSFRSYCTPPPAVSTNPAPAVAISMYDSDSSARCPDLTTANGISLPHSRTSITSISDSGLLMPGVEVVASRPAPGKAAKKSKKKVVDKDTREYREKRERNNKAVRKSREKNRRQIMETQKRVKELENENSQLQSKIALLSKELRVLKDLFASAGVGQPGTSCMKPEPGENWEREKNSRCSFQLF